jgi:outer membrane protein assembly factor BamB
MYLQRAICIRVSLGFVAGLFLSLELRADWPGLLGPSRDGHAAAGSKISGKPEKELRPIWELSAGQGYAGAAIQDQKGALYQRDGNEDVLRLVDLKDGKVQWRASFPASYRQGIDQDKGPRSVPQIADDCVVIQSASGCIHCVELASGKVRWSRELRKELNADEGYFGAGNTPLVSGGLVIVNVGGKKQKAGIVAISILDGKIVWAATDADAGYASPILYSRKATDGTETQLAIVPTRLTTYGMDLQTGQVRWEFPFGQRGPTVNAATPIVLRNGHVLQTSSYGIGYVSAAIQADRVEIVRQGDELASQYATPVSVGDYVFASDGREDGGVGTYKCLQPDSGKVLWEEAGMPVCHTIAIDGNPETLLLIQGVDGRIWSVPASDRGFKPIWQTRFPAGKYRALPAFSENRLLVRNSSGTDGKWMCFEL